MTFSRKAAKYASAAVLSFGLVFAVGCGDVYRPIADPITNPGGDPQNREVDAIINTNPNTDLPGSATFFSVSGDANLGNVSAAKGVTRASFDLFNSALYIPNPGSNNITYIFNSYTSSGITTTTRNITVAAGSNPIAIFPGSSSMYAINRGSVPECPGVASIGVIDIASQTLSQNVCVGASPVWAVFASSQNMLFVVDSAGFVTPIYAPQNATRPTISVGTNPVWAGMSLDGNYLFVINKGSSDISVIDVNTLTLVVPSVPTGGTNPVYGYLDKKLNRFYVVNQEGGGIGTLSSFNASNPLALTAFHAPVAVGSVPTRVSATADGERLYVANTGSNTITKVLANTFTAESNKTIQVNPDSTVRVMDAAVTRDGTKVYVATVTPDNMGNQTTIINTTDDSIVTSLASPRQDLSTCQTSNSTCQSQRQVPAQIVGTN